ncbi:hypothetical protein K0H59_05105 [Shewanella sp. FJAT-51649]|uniref:hypothetical protein n=1 Tax=Shewanella sp. FJAT-51649 TaxID=2864210 RepID=UPI001C6561EF|nr:hypothetical protein [Shewanella sp. FJAT-51649]QYJ72435.1 hypothetical protein K0H59_05105 [Shewanella sp. FJAT-51649]
MKTFWFMLLSGKSSFSLNVSCDNEDDLPELVVELLKCFGGYFVPITHEFKIDVFIRNTQKLRAKVVEYVERYKDNCPQVNKYNDFLNKLKDGDFFCLLTDCKSIGQKEQFEIDAKLFALNNPYIEPEVALEHVNELFGDFFYKYSIVSIHPGKKIKVGEPLKSKRICRFCKGSESSGVFFKHEAHAISESLGNKNIILNEECDTCNRDFSKTIEMDIDLWFKMHTAFFKVKTKGNKVPVIKGKNFSFRVNSFNDDSDFILTHSPDDLSVGDAFPKELSLEFNQGIVIQNVYKAFVKFSMSVISSSKIHLFEKTIEWLKGEGFVDALPLIAVLSTYDNFTKIPELYVYLRNDDDNNFPLAFGEFHYTHLRYVFIIPVFCFSEKEFIEKNEYNTFWRFLKHYEKYDNWSFQDFSNKERTQFVINMKLEVNSDVHQ